MRYIEVLPGDRIDLIALRAYGDSRRYDEIIRLNPTMDPWEPEPGTSLRVE